MGYFLKHYGMRGPLWPPLVTSVFLKVEGQNLVALGVLMCFLQNGINFEILGLL